MKEGVKETIYIYIYILQILSRTKLCIVNCQLSRPQFICHNSNVVDYE